MLLLKCACVVVKIEQPLLKTGRCKSGLELVVGVPIKHSSLVNGLVLWLCYLGDLAALLVNVSRWSLFRTVTRQERHRSVLADEGAVDLDRLFVDDLQDSGALRGSGHAEQAVARRQIEQFRPSLLQLFLERKVALEDGYHPTTFVQMRERYKTVEAIRRLIRSGELQSGFKRMKELGMLEWTIERAVIQFPEHFSGEEIEAARWRLQQGAALP
ncbi:MAG: hypothetical protein QOJ15_7743 [Bradyrhizobium sp.]|nr:hypothetical protein [Bradyrhizobium sp.]